jgi:hypothetical protein
MLMASCACYTLLAACRMAARDALRQQLVAQLGPAKASLFADANLDTLISEHYTSWQDLTEATAPSWREMRLPMRLFDAIQPAGL